jgi:pimeloyl-ACP methyl ester carboxylesterase
MDVRVPMQRVPCRGLEFDVWTEGDPSADPVVLLHGFPQDATSWSGIVGRLVVRGFRTVAPDQRGYSPGARPPGAASYRLGILTDDMLALADAHGFERFHVVGHDWGGAVAWSLAARYPDRVASLTSLSTPHPAAYGRALCTSPQAIRSLYFPLLALPYVPERVLAAGRGFVLERGLIAAGLDPGAARRYARRLSSREALSAALNWYRAALLPGAGQRVSSVATPTLLVWGSRDAAIDRRAVEASSGYVDGRYRLEVLAGAGHWLPENHADRVVPLLVNHLLGAQTNT